MLKQKRSLEFEIPETFKKQILTALSDHHNCARFPVCKSSIMTRAPSFQYINYRVRIWDSNNLIEFNSSLSTPPKEPSLSKPGFSKFSHYLPRMTKDRCRNINKNQIQSHPIIRLLTNAQLYRGA